MIGIFGVDLDSLDATVALGGKVQINSRHRGPDLNCYVFLEDENVFFSHTCLGISNPLTNLEPRMGEVNRLTITFNGEILNQRGLFSLKSQFTDPEVSLRPLKNKQKNEVSSLEIQFLFYMYLKYLKKLTFCTVH